MQEAAYGAGDISTSSPAMVEASTRLQDFVWDHQLVFNGVTVKSETLTSASTKLVLSDNTHVVLSGFVDTYHVLASH